MLSREELRAALETRDLADPAQGPHAIQSMTDALRTRLGGAWPVEVWTRRDHPVVTLADNYDNLGYAADAVTRDARYTRYAGPGEVLRSHTSAMVPPALRELARDGGPGDVLLVCAGICYRRDSVDWQHTGTPHQLDLWRITRTSACGEAELEEMIGLVVGAALPGLTWRTVPAVHPYTTAGRQVDVLWQGQWIEIAECGLAAPGVLRSAGLDDGWTGLAMGLGLDRLVMLRKGIGDIRLLRSADGRVAEQMLDLAPYRVVSSMPAVRRDLSVVIGSDVDTSAEALGDRVRLALKEDADAAESVEVRGETAYKGFPAAARERLRIEPGQRNLLVRLVLRPLDRTLTDQQANELRDRVYAELHEGPVAEWSH